MFKFSQQWDIANDASRLEINVLNYSHGISYLGASFATTICVFASAIFRTPFTIKYAGKPSLSIMLTRAILHAKYQKYVCSFLVVTASFRMKE